MYLPSRSRRQFCCFYLTGENSRRGMHTSLVSHSLFNSDSPFVSNRQNPFRNLQQIRVSRLLPSLAQQSQVFPQFLRQTLSQDGDLLPQPLGKHEHRASSTKHWAFLLLRGRRGSGFTAHFPTDPSQAVLLLTVNSLQHAWCCAKGMAVERKLTSHSELMWFSSFTISLSCFFVSSVNQNSLKLRVKSK